MTMQPKPELSKEAFEDWYNNEHGPLRLRLSFCNNGFRFRATDLEGMGKGKHEWMAVYDMTNLEDLNGDEYKKLRGPPVQTQRETDLRPLLDIDRKSFDFIDEWKADDYQPLDRIGAEQGGGVALRAMLVTLQPGANVEHLDRWYYEEHIVLLKEVPGWRRTRRFKTSTIEGRETTEYLALHEFTRENGLGGPEHQAASSTLRAKWIQSEMLADRSARAYEHYYTFGPAPRHISTVSNWSSPATLTRSIAPSADTTHSAIESYVSTPDGAKLQYRLEGSSSPSAPVVLCITSILAHYEIYDSFTEQFLKQNPQYRVLRYLSRGRTSSIGTTSPITLDTLTQDAVQLLSALRIPSVALAIGVSLGGATVLNLGLTHPTRVPVFLACDTNPSAPPSNPKAWGERIAQAEADTEAASSSAASDPFSATVIDKDDRPVGPALASATADRWFPQSSSSDSSIRPRIEQVRSRIASNSLRGFKASVKALYDYDMSHRLAGCKAKGAFLVGEEDGKLPAAMRDMASKLGDGKDSVGVKLTVVPGAGHLPMVDRPGDVVRAVEEMLHG